MTHEPSYLPTIGAAIFGGIIALIGFIVDAIQKKLRRDEKR